MAPLVIPVAVAAGTAAVGVSIGVTTIAAAAFSVAATAAAAGASYLLSPSDTSLTNAATGAEGPAAAPANGQRLITTREPLPARRIVYGETRVGGALVFQDNNNPYLYMQMAVSDGEIDAFTAFYIGETLVPVDPSGGNASAGTLYAGSLYVEYKWGLPTQVASHTLLAAFPARITADFRHRGVATVLTRMYWGDDATQHTALWGGSLAPTVQVRGVKVVDPRVTGTSPTSATGRYYSDNPALCLAHALHSAWDLALDYADIDWQSVADAADDCDALVTFGGASLRIFAAAGVLQSGHEMASQVAGMLSSFGGALYFADGKYRVRADKARASDWTITDDDILEIAEFVHEGEASAVPNAIKAQYADSTDAGVVAMSPVYEHPGTSSEPTRELVLRLPFTGQPHSAQILAYRELIRARDGRRLTLTVSDAGLWLEPYDVVTIASTSASWLDGVYQVMQVDMAPVGATLALRGYDPAAYVDPSGYLQ